MTVFEVRLMESTQVKVAINFVFLPFGTYSIENPPVPPRSVDIPTVSKPLYSFPSQTTRIEPASLANEVQVL